MKASLHSVRIAPKKANLIAKMVRGMPVLAAIDALKRTNKKAARLVQVLLESAVANAEHNEKQKGENLLIKTIIVNQGTSYRRGVPMARGRVRPMRKFLSHIDVTLGVITEEKDAVETKAATEKPKKVASKKAKTEVKSMKSSS